MMFDRGCRGSPDRCRRIRERGQRGREWASPVRTERAVLARDGRFGRQMEGAPIAPPAAITIRKSIRSPPERLEDGREDSEPQSER
jgi:hypothetical protein